MKTAYFNRFSIDMPEQCVDECSRPGPCDDSVSYWAPILYYRLEQAGQTIPPDAIRAELKEYGAWDDDELADDVENWSRIVWIAAGNIRDEERELAREAGQ